MKQDLGCFAADRCRPMAWLLAVIVALCASAGREARAEDHRPPAQGAGGGVAELAVRPGDRVLLRCGERYGPLHVSVRGTGAEPVRVGPAEACPGGQAPVIDGRRPLAWQVISEAGGSLLLKARPPTPAGLVFDGDRPLTRARYPAEGYQILPSAWAASDRQWAAGAAMAGTWAPGELVGARLHARTQEWLIEEVDVADDAGRLSAALRYPLRPKVGVYFSGKAWMIGQQPGWAQDRADLGLWVRSRDSRNLSAALEEPLLRLSGAGQVEIHGIQFQAAGTDAIQARLEGELLVRDVSVRWAAANGLAVSGARRVRVLDSSFLATGRDAIFFAEVQQVEVRGNRVEEAGLLLGPGQALAAINAHRTDAALIEQNIVRRSAYHGIRFAGQAQVRRNVLIDTCLLLSDCGALYTWRRHADDRRAAAELSHNLVVGVRGDTSVKFGVNDWFAGIYLDDYSNNLRVHDNVVVDANQGIYLHNAWDIEVANNFVRARQRGLVDKVDAGRSLPHRSRDNTWRSNDEALGRPVARWRGADGQETAFSFGGRVMLDLEPESSSPASAATGRCKPVAGVPASADGVGLPVLAVRECR